MKKLILSAAIVLGSLTTMSAQDQAPVKEKNEAPTEQAAPAPDNFTEIKAEELPAVVTGSLKKAFPNAVLNKAYINDKKEYKLEVKVGDKEGALFADANGKWIQK
ncbi:MAG: hypothetical protein V4497_04095 [Bacteroidota bacterium]